MKITRKTLIVIIAVAVAVLTTTAASAVTEKEATPETTVTQEWYFPSARELIEIKHPDFSFDIAKDYASLKEVNAELSQLNLQWKSANEEIRSKASAEEDYQNLREKLERKQRNFQFKGAKERLQNCFYYGCDVRREVVGWSWGSYQDALAAGLSGEKGKARYEKDVAEWLTAVQAMNDYESGKITIIQALNRLDADLDYLFQDGDRSYNEPFICPRMKLPSDRK